MRIKLVCLDPNSPKRKLVVHRLPVTIGRDAEAEIRVDDRWASRRHCQIEESDGTLVVRDLESRNGTLINGNHVTESPLMPGDKLTVGMSSFEAQYRLGKKRTLAAAS